MKRAVFSALLVLLLLLPVVGWAGVHYVSPTGTATWADSTSISTPCSVSTANTNAQAGDVVYFLDGNYTSKLRPYNSGTANNRIYFRSLNLHGAVFDLGSSSDNSIYIATSYITVDGFKVIPPWNGSAGTGIKVSSDGDNCHIKNVLVEGNDDENIVGIVLNAGGSNMLVDNCEVKHTRVGIMCSSSTGFSGTISNNIIHDLDMGDSSGADGIRVIGGGDFTGLTIIANEIYAYGGDGIDTYGSDNVTVVENIVHDPDTSASPDNGIKLGGTGSEGNIAQRNIIYNIPATNSGSAITTNGLENGTITYNLIHDCYRGIFVSSTNNKVYNNTVASCTRGIQVGLDLTATITNNILDGSEYDLYVDSGSTVSGGHNCLKNDSSVRGSGAYNGTGDLFATDPLLTPTYHLSHNSPCIDAGVKLSIHDVNWRDLAGNTVRYGTAPDIGCYEANTDRTGWGVGRWGVSSWFIHKWILNRWTPYGG